MATEKLSVIEFAKKRMMEEAKNGEDRNVMYWAAYLDGANAQLREHHMKAIGEGGQHDTAGT